MANNTNTNPIFIDTFTDDVVIFANRGAITSVVLISAAAGDDAVFIDNRGVECIHLAQNVAAGMVDWTPGKAQQFNNGVIFDVSASTGLGANDIVLIYLD